jgi:hypothetical protein
MGMVSIDTLVHSTPGEIENVDREKRINCMIFIHFLNGKMPQSRLQKEPFIYFDTLEALEVGTIKSRP